ncbi:M42 family metallopeptidase [Hespellia stercorisuis]|uniref:Putative aminopeptidase FrvX n=1 Tax=Hespellia stercorisuis DSM 15480 TaxID=1121950 RepID=A0A1M6JLW0_9FIRM|nr:M42 family metallopeptidase [Hespellia stercorisuis]SHJ47689.1 Putative aminopeptidase FrvX [Hespellia stercorisuis DSM 15480]
MNFEQYQDYFRQEAHALLSIDSASGFTTRATQHVYDIAAALGYHTEKTNLGNVIVTVDGKDNDHAVALSSHIDTLGLMVRSITSEGYLMMSAVGSPILPTLDGEYCNIYTRSGKVYTGTILSLSPAIHVFPDASDRPRDDKNMAVRIDETVHSVEDVQALGIMPGDYICYEPKTVFTESGFLKSRFIDDKGCATLLLTLLKIMKDENLKPAKKTYLCFTTHEEIGYGGATLPADIEELLVVDMGCVGDDLTCKEEQVSICAKDTFGPYDYDMTTELIQLSVKHEIDYATDIYPRYSSDAAALWRSGNDVRAALIGPGVHGSHGMERTHMDGLMNTLKLMAAYLELI